MFIQIDENTLSRSNLSFARALVKTPLQNISCPYLEVVIGGKLHHIKIQEEAHDYSLDKPVNLPTSNRFGIFSDSAMHDHPQSPPAEKVDEKSKNSNSPHFSKAAAFDFPNKFFNKAHASPDLRGNSHSRAHSKDLPNRSGNFHAGPSTNSKQNNGIPKDHLWVPVGPSNGPAKSLDLNKPLSNIKGLSSQEVIRPA